MKYIIVLCIGAVVGAIGMTLVSQDTYIGAKKETRSHIDSAVSSANTAVHNALQEGANATK